MLVSVLALVILTQYGATGAESDVSTVVNCAACCYASWPHDAWECDVKCNVAPTGVLIYGSVDAVAVTVSGVPGNNRPITANTIFKFDVVNVNIRGGYDPNTGIFTASIAGVYSVFFRTFTNSQHSKLHVKKNPATGSGEQEVCSAVVHDNNGSGDSCSMYVELNVGDQLYVKGQGSETGTIFAPNDTRKFVSFLIHLLYAANPLN